MSHKIFLLIFNATLAHLPGSGFSWLKRTYLKIAGCQIGRGVFIDSNTHIWGGGEIIIGDYTYIGRNVMIECDRGALKVGCSCEINYGSLLSANGGAILTVGNNSHIAHFVSLKCSTQSVNLSDVGIVGGCVYQDINIGMGSWLCAGCIVLPGVSIGKCNVIAAGAVVTKSSPDNVLLAGVPAVVKKTYTKCD